MMKEHLVLGCQLLGSARRQLKVRCMVRHLHFVYLACKLLMDGLFLFYEEVVPEDAGMRY